MSEDGDDRYLAYRSVMMPHDTNPHGTVFGGAILSQIDLGGSVGAHHEIRCSGSQDRPLMLVGMNKIEFHEPVFVGDVVTLYTRLVRIGRTSITMRIDVEAQRAGKTIHVTQAEATYVAVEVVDGQRRPVAIRGDLAV
jgi:acyl-CoA thioesterase YciA